jgi:hypothetical protein
MFTCDFAYFIQIAINLLLVEMYCSRQNYVLPSSQHCSETVRADARLLKVQQVVHIINIALTELNLEYDLL